MRRAYWRFLGWAAYIVTEIAFRTDCWIPGNYRLGCKLYWLESDYGIRHGFLKKNPKRTKRNSLPMYIEA